MWASIIIILLFVLILYKQLKCIKKLMISTRKSPFEIIMVIICVSVIGYIMITYGKSIIHYFVGVLGITAFIAMWAKEGITYNGFLSMYKYKEEILWHEIKKIDIKKKNNFIKFTLHGGFMEQTFEFKKMDYDKVMKILRENMKKGHYELNLL